MFGSNFRMLIVRTRLAFLFLVLGIFSCISPTVAAATPDELTDLSLAELSNIEVTSVSKMAEKESEAAAAIYVITQEDIKNSGSTSIPDLLRMAPGITVAQAGAHDWTVTSRGSNDQFSNKLLVLMDGRTIYSPLFSGVIWEVQDTMLEDIDRIEVIRGPGATLWGANAVNGVINIITKNSKDTQGGLAVATAGNKINGIGSIREGIKTGDDSYVRTYAKQTNYDSQDSLTGGSAGDSWNKSQAGFRSDSKISDIDKLTVQGDIYNMFENVNYLVPDFAGSADPITGNLVSPAQGLKSSGGNIMARWEQKQSDQSQTSMQVYFDNTYRSTSFFNDEANTIDLDIQHVWTGWNKQEIVWGVGYRFINDKNDPASDTYSLTPATRNDSLYSAFVQDKFTLIPNSVFLTLGSKFEHNDYTGVEVQPSARLSWLPAENQTLWASVSRAVHTPYRYTDDATQTLAVVPSGTYSVAAIGNRDLKSEELIAYELGYRIKPIKSLSFDLSTFYNEYSNLFHTSYGTFTTFLPIAIENGGGATSKGAELSIKWNVLKDWQLAGAYSYLDEAYDQKDSVGFSFVGKSPKHQFNIRSVYILPYNIEMTNALYYVNELNYIDQLSTVHIPGYYRFDTKFSYAITSNIELSLVAQNILDSSHQEFTAFQYASPASIGRSVFASAAIKF